MMMPCRMRYHFWGGVVLGSILIFSGCAAHQAMIQGDAAPAHQMLLGTWENPGRTTYIIREMNGSPSVVSVYGGGGEDYEIKSVKWDGVKLSWTYRIPSSGVEIEVATQVIQENTLRCTYFSPIGGPGVWELRRIE